MAKHPPAKMSAVLGRCRRTGRWRLAARSNVLAVFGSVRLDMRHSFVEGDEPDELKMKVMVLFGSAVLILPEGAEVRPSGMSVLSAEWVDVPDHPPSGLPTLEVEWTCVLGRVHVVTGSVLEKAAAEKAAAEQVEAEPSADERHADGAPEPWVPASEPMGAEQAEPEPAAEIVVDMGMVDPEPWSMSDFDVAEPEPSAPEPEPAAPEPSEPEAEPSEPAPEREVEASDEAAAPQLVEAWRTHDWGPGITHRDAEDEETGEAAAGSEAGSEATPEAMPETETGDEVAAPQLVEAWRTHDWGPGIIHRDDEDEETGEAAAGSEAGSEATPEVMPETETGDEVAAPQLVEAWRTHDWGPGIIHRDDEDEEDDESAPAGASA